MMRKRTIRLISISIILVLTFLIASAGTFAASKPILKKGMSGTAVKTLQLNLKKLGFFSGTATGFYGDLTVTAVKKFQKKYKIPTTGVVASLTYSKLDELLKPKSKPKPAPAPQKPKPEGLQAGNTGDEVVLLQSNLNILGYMKAAPTGEFDSLTENAVIQFQKKYGLEQHGVADTLTITLIERLLEQGGLNSRGGGARESLVPVEIAPLYEVKKDWISGAIQSPFIDGIGKYQGVVFHYTANPGDSARIEADYVKSNWRSAFVHEFIDADEIIQVADPDYKAWGAGQFANDKFIHLELCHESTQSDFDISYKKIIRRTAEYLYMNQLGVSPAKADGSGTLWGHIDVSRYLGGTDHSDPIAYLAKWGITWSDVIEDVTDEYVAIASAGAPEAPGSDSAGYESAAPAEAEVPSDAGAAVQENSEGSPEQTPQT